MDQRAKDLIGLGDKLFTDKQQLHSLWQEIAEHMYPARADVTRLFNPGEVVNEVLMDSTPVLMHRDFSDYIGMSRDQYKIRTMNEHIDERDDVAKWLDDAGQVLGRALRDRRSQYKRATKGGDRDWSAFGNVIISVDEGQTKDHLLFRNWHPRDCAWMENDEGEVDCFHRKVKMTARNMVRRFKGRTHQAVQDAADKSPSTEFDVRCIVVPSDEYNATTKRRERFPFYTLYIDVTHQMVMEEVPRLLFPYVVGRWSLVSGYPYGFSPVGMTALPEARMLQTMARIIIEQGEKAVDPPMAVVNSALRSDINLYAGGITSIDADSDDKFGKAIQAIQNGGDVRLGVEMREDVRKLLKDAFYLTKLFLPNEREMTAEEAALRNQEFIRAATPIFDPLEESYNGPLLDKAFQILLRTAAFDPNEMPDVLSSTHVSFVFDNPVKAAESRLKLASAQETLQVVTGVTQFNPKAPTRINFDQLLDDAVRGTGAPADWFQSDENIAAAGQQMDQQAQLAKSAQMLQAGAGVGEQVAHATTALQGAGLV